MIRADTDIPVLVKGKWRLMARWSPGQEAELGFRQEELENGQWVPYRDGDEMVLDDVQATALLIFLLQWKETGLSASMAEASIPVVAPCPRM